MSRLTKIIVLLAIIGAGCAPAGPSGQRQSEAGPQGRSPATPKVLVAAINEDPRNFWDGINGGGGGGARELGHMVNQYLANIGPDGQPIPRLLAEQIGRASCRERV